MPATWDSLTLCTESDVTGELRDIHAALVIERGSETLSATIAAKIALAKADIRRRMLLRLPELFAVTVQSVLAVEQARANAEIEYNRADPELLEISFTRMVLGSQRAPDSYAPSYGVRTIYSGTGVPDADYKSDVAVYGDLYIDIYAGRVYIRTIVTIDEVDSDTWTQLTPAHLLDCIVNPTELTACAVAGTIHYLLQDAIMRNNAGGQDLALMVDRSNYWTSEFTRRYNEAEQLLQIDFTGDGVVSDFELTRSQARRYGV